MFKRAGLEIFFIISYLHVAQTEELTRDKGPTP